MREEIEELYQAEQKQNEINHHLPTAGAMTNHILANLRVMSTKLNQLEWYIKGNNYFADQQFLSSMRQTVDNYFNQLGHQLVNAGEKPSSITEEFSEYKMLMENARNKYLTDQEMLAMLVDDIQTSKMFISRAIILAQNESKFPLQNFLIELDGSFNQFSAAIQARLGKEPLEGLEEDDDEEDDD